MRTSVHRLCFRTILALVSVFVLFLGEVKGQVVVTNPGNTTPNLSGTYTSLAQAITALNAVTSITGPVIITLTGNETAPAGGYAITQVNATAAKNITIQGAACTITAFSPQVSGLAYDAIFKIIGGDYITIQNFTMQENPSNNTYPASNNMTEWGVALLTASLTNGAQHNTIQNNIISLNRNYVNSVGIYSNVRHSATVPGSGTAITATTGSNSNNTIYNNLISNVNMGIVFVGANNASYMDIANDIGGSSASNGNTISDWGNILPNSGVFSSVPLSIFGIFTQNQTTLNLSYNTLVSAVLDDNLNIPFRGILMDYSISSSGSFSNNITHNSVSISSASTSNPVFEGIKTQGTGSLPGVTLNVNYNTIFNCAIRGTSSANKFSGIYNTAVPNFLNISYNIIRSNTTTATGAGFEGIRNDAAVVNSIAIDNNQIGNASGNAITFSSVASGSVFAIRNIGGAATSSLSIQNNNIQGIVFSVGGVSSLNYISNVAATLAQTISNNTFTNLNANTTGGVNFISDNVILPSNGNQTVSNNRIVTAFVKSGGPSPIFLFYSAASADPTSTITHIQNNFSNITLPLNNTMYGWSAKGAGSNSKTFSNNTFSNWFCGTQSSTPVTVMDINTGTNTISNNTISAIKGYGSLTAINLSAPGIAVVSSNTISGISNVMNESIHKPGSPGTSVYGITTSITTSNISKNKIYNISNNYYETGIQIKEVAGINITGGTIITLTNNYVGDIRAPIAYKAPNAVIGINITGGIAINAYYNTVWLNGSSTNWWFGSSAIYAVTTSTVDLRNNIFVNTSRQLSDSINDPGLTVAYRRSSTTLGTAYAITSNNNLFYAGTPGQRNLIFYDGTNAVWNFSSYQQIVSPRDNASITENPPFISTIGTSPLFLHIDNACFNPPSSIDCGAVPLILSPDITDDFDGDIRWGKPGYTGIGSAPDIGADEFNSASVVVTATAGTPGPTSYNTLRAAFAKINDGTHKGTITIKLYCNTIETATAVLNASGGAASYTSVLIYPMVTGLSIRSNLSTPNVSNLIDLNGADNVTIDGRVNLAGAADLSIIHTGTDITSRNLLFRNSAQNNKVRYCKINGSCQGAASANVFFSTSSTGGGNYNNVIDHCELSNSGARPLNTIASNGSAAPNDNRNNTISNNIIYDFLNSGDVSNGIYLQANSSSWSVTGNSFYETSSFVPAASVEYDVIRISNTSGTNFTISGNYIGGTDAFCGGSPWTKTNIYSNTFFGIYFDASNSTSSSIQGNTIQNFLWANSGAANWTGIHVESGIVNVGNIIGNTIGDGSSTGSISISNNGITNANVYGINHNSSGNGIIQNNTIGSITTTNASSTFPTNFYGIYKGGGAGAISVINNFIGSEINVGSINASSAVSGNSQSVYGIYYSASANVNITGNTIANMTNANSGAGITAGIYLSNAVGTSIVNQNFIHSLINTNINPFIYGIRIMSGLGPGAGTYSNNIIVLGSNVTAGCNIYGINEGSSSISNIYFNTVYIGGSVSSGGNSSWALYSGNSNTRNFRNNILYNARSGGGTNYAIRLGGIANLTIDYNDYYAPGNTLGYLVTPVLKIAFNIADWRTATGQDLNSSDANPGFSGAGGTIVNGYKPTLALSGTAISGITTDYNAVTRANPPTMGALESESITTTTLSANPACTGSPLTICFTSTGTFASGNIYKAQLSDASGSFDTYVDLAPTLISFASGALCLNNVIIPASTAPGTSYRIRVVSNNPAISADPGIQFTIKQSPKLSFSQVDVTCANPSIGYIDLTVTLGSPTGYLWTSDNGFNLAAQQNNQDLTGLTAGTYTVTVTDNNGCSTIGSATIVTTTLPPAPTLTSALPCVGNKPQFVAGNGTIYQFFFNGVSQGPPSGVNTYTPASFLMDGDEVCVRSGAVGCYSETCITIHAVLAPTANNVTVCYDGSLHSATASSIPGTSIVYYTSGGSITTAPTAVAVGTYTAYAEAVDNTTSCKSASRTPVTLIIKSRPAIYQVSNSIYCNSDAGTILFSSSSDAGGTYDWTSSQDIGFGSSGSGIAISFFAANGTNAPLITTISATYTLNGCASLPMIFNNTVYPTPIVNPLADLTYCNGDVAPVIHFTSPTSGTLHFNWTYSGNSGLDSLVFAPVNATASPVTEPVNVIATDVTNGCSAGPVTTFDITVNPSPVDSIATDYCSVPNHIVLTAFPAGQSSYLWNISGYTTPAITVSQAGNYGVTTTNSYGCQGSAYLNLGTELVTDGSFTNFSAASPSFTSAYIMNQGYYDGYNDLSGIMKDNRFAVNESAWSKQPLYPIHATPLNNGYHVLMHGRDHTNNTVGKRNFMMVNGSTGSNVVVWQQTVPVTFGRDYYFSAWAMNLTAGYYAKLQFQINGVAVGTVLDLASAPKVNSEDDINLTNWARFFNTTLWTPPNAGVTTAVIRIINLNPTKDGNDFGLDDISFGLLASIPDASSAAVGGGGSKCTGNDLFFSVNNLHGGTPPYTYLWTGPDGFIETVPNPTILNAQPSNTGDYSLVVTDDNGCQSAPAITHVDVIPLPVPPTSALADRPAICTNDGGTITLSVLGGSGQTVKWYTDDCGVSEPPIGFYSPPQSGLTIASPVTTQTYYARWESACGISTCTSVTVTVGSQWTGANNNTNWNETGNWKLGCGIPDATKDAIISNIPPKPQPHINITGAACKNLTIDASGSLIVDAGKSLTVSGDATNNGAFTVLSDALGNNGSLIVEGNSVGNVIYNRYLENNRWFITSPPVNNAFSLNSSIIDKAADNTFNFAPYDEPDNYGWNWVTSIPTYLNPGQGYLLKLSAGNTIQYSGALNPTLNVLVTNSPSAGNIYDNGWNAVGNPFTSALKITGPDGFITQNLTKLETSYNAVYLWYEETGPYTGTEQFYRVINNAGYTGKAYGGPIPDSYVQAGQGFLINAGTPGTSFVTFKKGTAGMQVHSPTLTMKSSETSWPGLTLLAENNGRISSTVVAFNENMTTGLDPSYDAGLLTTSDFNIYTHLVAGGNETDFTIQCLPENIYESLIVPIGLDVAQPGKVTFKVAGVILPEGLYPVIEDSLLQVSIPLRTENDSLVADLAEASWGIGRFYLHIGGEAVITDVNANTDAHMLTARYSDQKIVIFGLPEAKSKARLYDISGRLLGGEYRLTATTQNMIPQALSNGIYLLRIEGTTSRQTLKITVVN